MSKAMLVLCATVILAEFTPLSAVSTAHQEQAVPKVFQAQAMGQTTQAGKTFNITIRIDKYSTPEERRTLIDAFNKSGSQGVYDALSKMDTKGRIAVTGTVGTDINFARWIQTQDGITIRILTNRPINFGEAYNNGRSMDYNLSAVELKLSDQPDKDTGTLLPASKITVDKKTNEVQFEAFQNPWKLTNIRDVTSN